MEPDTPNFTPVEPGGLPDPSVPADFAVGTGSLTTAVFILIGAIGLSLLARRFGKVSAAVQYRRWLPVIYASIWGLAVVVITMIYAEGLPGSWILILWLFFLILIFASVGWLRSVMSGVAVAVEHRLDIGDSIRVGDVEGEITAFGLRSIQIRSVDGTIHEVPNEKFVTESVANLSGDGGDSACEIVVRVPGPIEPQDALRFARETAILTPLASPRHEPEVFLKNTDGGATEISIRGYAFDPAYQEHYRSDVLDRLMSRFREIERRTAEAGARASSRELVLSED